MSRRSPLAHVPAVVLSLALLVGCERSATDPAQVTAPRFGAAHATDNARLQAPEHKGGKQSGVIGRHGGRLHFDDASAPGVDYWLDVPAGAVRSSTTFEMEVLPGAGYDVSLKATVAGRDVGKDGFGQPVRLTISYATARHPVAPLRLTVAWLPDGGADAIPVKTQINPGQKTLTGYLPHFSKYTVIYW